MRQRILGSQTPPCHRRMVITTQFSVLPCCTAAQTSSVPIQVALDCALALAICTSGSARTHHPPSLPPSLLPSLCRSLSLSLGVRSAGGGGVLLAEVLMVGNDPGQLARHVRHLDRLATRQQGHAQAHGDSRHVSCRRLGLCMPCLQPGQKEPSDGGVEPHPLPPLGRRTLGLTLRYRSRGPALRRQVQLQGFHLGSEAILIAAKGLTLRLGGTVVFNGLIKAGLQVELRGLRDYRADLPRRALLLLLLLLLLHVLYHAFGEDSKGNAQDCTKLRAKI